MQTVPNSSPAGQWVRQYWFLIALFVLCLATVADRAGMLAAAGRWLKTHHGPDLVVMIIFLLSGFALSPQQIKNGLRDAGGVLLALVVIFLAAPLAAVLLSRIPLDPGIVIGLFLVAVMPSTLSSGVVMTQAAGGNAAHALVTTIVANSLSVFTIPWVLPWLLASVGQSAAVTIDKAAIMLKIGLLVVLPLMLGMAAKHVWGFLERRAGRKISVVNQCMVLVIVWIAMSQTRDMLVSSGMTVALVVVLVCVYHSILLLCSGCLIWVSGRERGRRESVLFMGGQKTLPLSVILQMALFPQYGLALLVCVLHHLVHLMMDAYLVERLKDRIETGD